MMAKVRKTNTPDVGDEPQARPPAVDVVKKATRPDGAIVSYVGEGTPASGSLFPVGSTTVTLGDGSTFVVTVTP